MSLDEQISSLAPDIHEPDEPAKDGKGQHPTILEIGKSFKEYGDEPADPFMFADVDKIIQKSLFPEISKRALSRQIESYNDGWSQPSTCQRKEILERKPFLNEPN